MRRNVTMGQTDLVLFFTIVRTKYMILCVFLKVYFKTNLKMRKGQNRQKLTWDNYAQNGSEHADICSVFDSELIGIREGVAIYKKFTFRAGSG